MADDAISPDPSLQVSDILLSMMSPAWRHDVETAAKSRPELFGHPEPDLRKILTKLDAGPTYLDNIVRLNFWREYDLASEEGFRKIPQQRVWAGAMNESMFNKIMKIPHKVCWMVCPIQNYDTRIKEALAFSTEQLREILDYPIIDKTGKINVSLANLKMRIHAMLDVKIHGMAIQRIEQKNLNVNVSNSGTNTSLALEDDMEYLQKKLSDLNCRDKLLKREAATAAIQIESTPIPEPREVVVEPK